MMGMREVAPDGIGLDLAALAPLLAAVGPLAVIDFETTGLPEEGPAEPIEVGAVLLDRDRVRVFDTRIRPRARVPRAVTALTGLSDADLADAPRIEAVATALLAALAGRAVIAHNAEFERHFLTRFVSPSLARARFLDTQDLFALAYPDAPDLRLATLTERAFGRTSRHRALDDALDTARLISELATEACAGGARAAATRAVLDAFAPDEPWAALVAARGRAPASALDATSSARPRGAGQRVPSGAGATPAPRPGEAPRRRHFPRYRARAAEIEMAREFVRLLDEGGRLLLEGGTGGGKSLAY